MAGKGERSLLIKFIGESKSLEGAATKSSSSLGRFKDSVGNAEGAVGKLKAGATSAFDSVKANSGLLAVAGGAALVSFGLKALHAFQDAAKGALDLGAATGLSVEQASRWIAIGDDVGVSADELQGSLGKIAKTLDDTKWAEYGIATRDAGGEARPVNDILIDSFDKLSQITNETERARAGQDLFGKSYQNLTPLIGQTKDEYLKMLDAVSDGQVITQAETEKAERMRLAEDALGDALADVSLAFGEMIAAATPALDIVVKVAEGVAKLTAAATGSDAKSMSKPLTEFGEAVDGFSGSGEDIARVANALTELGNDSATSQSTITQASKGISLAFDDLFTSGNQSAVQAEKLGLLRGALDELWETDPGSVTVALEAMYGLQEAAAQGNEKAQEWLESRNLEGEQLDGLAGRYSSTADAAKELADEEADGVDSTDESAAAHRTLSGDLRKTKEALDGTTAATLGVDRAYDQLTGKLTNREAWLNLQSTAEAHILLMQDSEATDREKELSLIGLQQETADYALSLEGIPPQKMTEVLALIDQGKIDEANWILGVLTAERQVKIIPYVVASKGVSVTYTGTTAKAGDIAWNAEGTTSAAPGLSWVGEKGPELRSLRGGETIMTASDSMKAVRRANADGGGGGGISVVQHVNIDATGMSPEHLVQALSNRSLEQIRRGLANLDRGKR